MTRTLSQSLSARFQDAPQGAAALKGNQTLHSMAGRGSCRSFKPKMVPTEMLDTLCAVALSSPSKSDLQQRDIILLHNPDQRQRLAALVPDQGWIAEAPMIAVFCGNNRRQRLLHDHHGIAFANDHLDAFFNAACDAAIALGAFVTAAEANGLGTCPISGVRNDAAGVSDLLGLPDHVFPMAGLAIGYPKAAPVIAPRLPLGVTCHQDRYSETGLEDQIAAYADWRAEVQPYATQRLEDTFGNETPYTWSIDKIRQYSRPERAGFGAFIRAKGFNLD